MPPIKIDFTALEFPHTFPALKSFMMYYILSRILPELVLFVSDQRYIVRNVNLLCCIGIAYLLLKCDSHIFQMLVFVCTNDVTVQANPNIVD